MAQERRRMAIRKTAGVKKTMQEVLISKGYTNSNQALEFLRGKTIILNTTCSYGSKGNRIKIDSTYLGSGGAVNGGYIYAGSGAALYFRYMAVAAETIEELTNEIADNEKSIKELGAENELIRSKIEFMQTNALEEFDDEVFKTYHVLKQLDNKKLTDIEKAKIIARIIKSS